MKISFEPIVAIALLAFSIVGCSKNELLTKGDSIRNSTHEVAQIVDEDESGRTAQRCGWRTAADQSCDKPLLVCDIVGNQCKCGKVKCPTQLSIEEWQRVISVINSYEDIYDLLSRGDEALLAFLDGWE